MKFKPCVFSYMPALISPQILEASLLIYIPFFYQSTIKITSSSNSSVENAKFTNNDLVAQLNKCV